MSHHMKTPRDLFLHELGDALTFENTILEMLPKMEQEASDPELQRGFKRHQAQTRQHIKNIERAFKAMKEKPESEDCPAIEGLKKEHDEFVKEDPSPEILDAFLADAAAKTEHYEIASYTGLVAKARALGEKEAADALDKNLKEDKLTLQAVTKVSRRLAREGAKQMKEMERATAGNGGRSRSRASSGGSRGRR